jgi:hypothetical protein
MITQPETEKRGMLTTAERFVRNALGQMKGYSACPSCGDSWMWKTGRSAIWFANGGSGISICDECMELPTLDSHKIANHVRGYKWPEGLITQAVTAIEKRNTERLSASSPDAGKP